MERDINLQVVHPARHSSSRELNIESKKINIDPDEAVHNELLQLDQYCLPSNHRFLSDIIVTKLFLTICRIRILSSDLVLLGLKDIVHPV